MFTAAFASDSSESSVSSWSRAGFSPSLPAAAAVDAGMRPCWPAAAVWSQNARVSTVSLVEVSTERVVEPYDEAARSWVAWARA